MPWFIQPDDGMLLPAVRGRNPSENRAPLPLMHLGLSFPQWLPGCRKQHCSQASWVRHVSRQQAPLCSFFLSKCMWFSLMCGALFLPWITFSTTALIDRCLLFNIFVFIRWSFFLRVKTCVLSYPFSVSSFPGPYLCLLLSNWDQTCLLLWMPFLILSLFQGFWKLHVTAKTSHVYARKALENRGLSFPLIWSFWRYLLRELGTL